MFESVEAVPPIELGGDEGAPQRSAPGKALTGTGDGPQQPSADLSDQRSASESSPLPAAAESAEASNPSTKPAEGEEIVGQHKDEISGSESEQRCRSDRSDATLRCQGEGNSPDVLSESKAAETNLRSAPEKTNVLKLETEVRNEYFQAPPLGETLAFQALKSKCDQAAEQNDLSPSASASIAQSEPKAVAALSEIAECKKIAEIPAEKPGSNSPVRQVLNALQSLSHSRQSPDTAESDDSPSALEMEDIPMGITCVTSEDMHSRPLVGLAPPPACFSLKDKMAPEELVSDRHLDTDCNTSPEGTDLGLSEEEPEMENVLPEAESAETGGAVKREGSGGQVYSVSVPRAAQAPFLSPSALTNTIVSAARDAGHVPDQFTSHRQGRPPLRQTVLVLHFGKPGEAAEHHVQVQSVSAVWAPPKRTGEQPNEKGTISVSAVTCGSTWTRVTSRACAICWRPCW